MLTNQPLSLALAGLLWPPPDAPSAADAAPAEVDAERLRPALLWAVRAGFRAVQLNAAAPGLRARDLDRSARRDLAATLRRQGLALSGLDLWIPPEHFRLPDRQDRAVSATLGAIELTAELIRLDGGPAARPVLSVGLPADIPDAMLNTLATHAAHHGCTLADHAWPRNQAALAAGLGKGVDPAAVLMAGGDVLTAAAAGPLAAARLSDVTFAGRCGPASPGGRLDLLAYHAALHAANWLSWVTLDLRLVPDQPRAAARAAEAWQGVTANFG
jgi:sugar phosphate isomerase/epimerase